MLEVEDGLHVAQVRYGFRAKLAIFDRDLPLAAPLAVDFEAVGNVNTFGRRFIDRILPKNEHVRK